MIRVWNKEDNILHRARSQIVELSLDNYRGSVELSILRKVDL
jgi:hypothetical protein